MASTQHFHFWCSYLLERLSGNSYLLVPEFRLLFPQLTGVLTLAFFIHNCVITIMKSNKNQENNVSLVQSDTISGLVQFVWFYWILQNCFQRKCQVFADWLMNALFFNIILFSAGAGPVGGLPPGRTDLPVRRSADLCCVSLTASLQRLHWTSEIFHRFPFACTVIVFFFFF